MAAGILITNYDTSSIFLGDNFYKDFTHVNTTGSIETLVAGTLFGQILASGNVLPNLSSATDGSELPMGILQVSVSVAIGATVTLPLCIAGRVNGNQVTYGAGDTLLTAVRTVSTGGGTIGALITRNTDIKLVATTELSAIDNQ